MARPYKLDFSPHGPVYIRKHAQDGVICTQNGAHPIMPCEIGARLEVA